MEDLELTTMQRAVNDSEMLKPILDRFTANTRVPVHHTLLNWGQSRAELIRMALYHHGADVSEIGTTWVSDLIAMNALRPFTKAEVDQLGPVEAFLPVAFKTTHTQDDPQIWSMPWLTEVFTLHYRKDVLAKANIDERSAFATSEQLYETACRLRDAGYEIPIALPPVSPGWLIMHIASTWVWQEGGDFLSPDHRQVIFNESNAIAGFIKYFRLVKTISDQGVNQLNSLGIANCFWTGHAPMAIGSSWINPFFAPPGAINDENWGITRLPGPSFVGGSNLVIWKHSRQDNNALNLVKHLMSDETTQNYIRQVGMLSPRTRMFSTSPFAEDRFTRVAYEALQTGRAYPTFSLWGLVEERLVHALIAIWDSIRQDPDVDLEVIIPKTLNQVARNLNLTLSSR